MEKMNAKKIIWIAVVVVVVVGIAVYVLWTPKKPAAPGAVPVYAPKGELAPGFPKALILDNAAAVNNSYSINYAASTNQYTAQWNSSSSMGVLYNAYKQYLIANGWTITNDVTRYPTSRGLYGRNASSDVSVAIITAGSGSQITVTYLAK